jgi:hypothetical protein
MDNRVCRRVGFVVLKPHWMRLLVTIHAHATVLRSGPYRFYFYSHEPNEPPHVHVDRDDLSAKFWLDPVALAPNFGFNARELGLLYGIIVEHQQQLLEAWHGYFGTRRG